jgi:predicted dehydrogenase
LRIQNPKQQLVPWVSFSASNTLEKGKSIMAHRTTRRGFIKAGAAAGAGFWLTGRGAWAQPAGGTSTSPSEKLNLGLIGVMGRAEQSMSEEDNAVASQNIVALCDVDEKNLSKCAERFPKAEKYADFRKLLERKDIDAVMVSTADHTHAAATLMALNSGRHVYCEKPLTHTVAEARRVAETAARMKRVTQIGTQIHAGENYRRVVELVRGGAIGKVSDVHCFIDKVWAPKEPLPQEASPIPENLNYDLWLGPVPFRPFHKEYHPQSWRRYWAFGSGTLGDMGCHYMDLPFWALGLKYPTRIKAEGPQVSEEGAPPWIKVHYDFVAGNAAGSAGAGSPVKLHWYDGGHRPDGYDDWKLPKNWVNGIVFVGEKGNLFADYNVHRLFPEADFADYKPPEKSIPKSIGHHREWIEACRKNDPKATTCHFGYSGPLTETVLLGVVAYRSGKELQWDAKNLRITNAPDAERFLRSAYRPGWGMESMA